MILLSVCLDGPVRPYQAFQLKRFSTLPVSFKGFLLLERGLGIGLAVKGAPLQAKPKDRRPSAAEGTSAGPEPAPCSLLGARRRTIERPRKTRKSKLGSWSSSSAKSPAEEF